MTNWSSRQLVNWRVLAELVAGVLAAVSTAAWFSSHRTISKVLAAATVACAVAALLLHVLYVLLERREQGGARTRDTARRSWERVAMLTLRVALGVAVGALLVAGYALGHASPGKRDASGGVVTVQAPSDWAVRTSHVRPPAGIRLLHAVRLAPPKSARAVFVGVSRATGPALLDREPLRRLPRPPSRADRWRLGDLSAYRYERVRPRGTRHALTLLVAPTTIGVVTVACTVAQTDCMLVAGTLRLRGGRGFPLGPSSRFATTVNATLSLLTRRRHAARADLRNASTSTARADAALKLRRAFAQAAGDLRARRVSPADGDARDAFASSLARAGTAYSHLRQAAEQRDAAAFADACAEVMGAERRVDATRKRFRALGYRLA
jgi:hypothetical protein